MIDVSLSQSFLNPKSVAIIGASADPKKTSSRAQRFLVSHGYNGKIFPVNPNREEIFGLKCYPNLKSINEHIDHIFVAVNGVARTGSSLVGSALPVESINTVGSYNFIWLCDYRANLTRLFRQ